MVEGSFLILSEKDIKGSIGLLGSRRLYDADAIHDAMDMGIDTDIGRVVEDTEDDFGSLYADTRESSECIEVVWHRAAILISEYPCGRIDVARFRPEIIHRADEALQLLGSETEHILRRPHPREKRRGGAIDLTVRGLRRQHDGDEQLKGGLIVELGFRTGLGLLDGEEYTISLFLGF